MFLLSLTATCQLRTVLPKVERAYYNGVFAPNSKYRALERILFMGNASALRAYYPHQFRSFTMLIHCSPKGNGQSQHKVIVGSHSGRKRGIAGWCNRNLKIL